MSKTKKKKRDQVAIIRRKTAVAIMVRDGDKNKYYITSVKYVRYFLQGRIKFLYVERQKKLKPLKKQNIKTLNIKRKE